MTKKEKIVYSFISNIIDDENSDNNFIKQIGTSIKAAF